MNTYCNDTPCQKGSLMSFLFLAKLEDSIVAARQGNIMITSFHPELTDDLRFHKYFVDMIINAQVLIMSSNTRSATCVAN